MIRFLIFSLISTFIWADDGVNVTVDRRDIIEGDSITLTVTASNLKKDSEVQLPDLQDFKVASGPNQSSSTNVQFINGKMTKKSTTTLSWSLIPKKIGKLTIPGLKINVGKKSYMSTPIIISVSKRGSKQSGKVSQFFIEALVDNKNPFRGEQTTITYTLYTKVDITSFEDELPSFKGFWTEELFAPKNLKLREVRKNDIQYFAATIKKIALFPTQSGRLIIEPMSAIIGVREPQQRWNDFSLFGPPSKKYTISTNRLEIDVKPLPDRLNGEVSAITGNWNIRSEINTNNVKQDEAITFKVVITGTGNLKTVDINQIQFPNEIEVFDPEVDVHANPLRDKIGGEKKYEWVLIPRYAGDLIIPPIDLNYFDLKLKKWKTNSTPTHKLKVLPNEKSVTHSLGLSKEEVALVGEDIRFIDETQPHWRNLNTGLFTSTTLILLLFSGIIFAFPSIQNFTINQLEKSSGGWYKNRALNSALDIINSAPENPEEIYAHISKGIVSYVNIKLGVNKYGYSNEEINNIFKSQKCTDYCEEIEQILIRGEAVRFAPVSSQDATNDQQKIKLLLKKADNVWT